MLDDLLRLGDQSFQLPGQLLRVEFRLLTLGRELPQKAGNEIFLRVLGEGY